MADDSAQISLWDFGPDDLIKRCKKCGVVKPLDAFYAHPTTRSRRQEKCKDCAKTAMLTYHHANAEELNASRREQRKKEPRRFWAHDLKKFNVTPDQYDEMFEQQGGLCAICGTPPKTGKRLAIDHDHSCCPTRQRSCAKCIRGLLCGACNSGLGLFDDDPELLLKAAEYLHTFTA